MMKALQAVCLGVTFLLTLVFGKALEAADLPSDVVIRVEIPGAIDERGLGALRLRIDACTVITPKHVVKNSLLPHAQITVEHPDGAQTSAELVHLDAPGDLSDLAILRLPLKFAHLCANSSLEQPKSVQSYLSSDSLMLDVIEADGRHRRLPLFVISSDAAQIEIASRVPQLPLRNGYSGAMIRAPDGASVGMLTEVDPSNGLGKAYRWDHVLTRLANWYLLGDDTEPNCRKAAPVISVPDGATLSSIVTPDSAKSLNGWTSGNLARRLAAGPVLRIEGRFDVDIEQPIVACRVEMAKGSKIVHRGVKPLDILALDIVADEGALITSEGADGADVTEAAAAAPGGASFNSGSRRGCGGTRHGGPGTSGVDGRFGGDGSPSAGIRLAAARINGPLAIQSRGGEGGQGQAGGEGGRGGNGEGASSGSSSAFDCKCGGNPGGRGGDGGSGGRGGAGGRGGNAGPITLIVGSKTIPPSAVSKGGSGGDPGSGGMPGGPGGGGAGSGGTGFCSGQRGSDSGLPGPRGGDGAPGADGTKGPITIKDFGDANNAIDWPGFLFTVRSEFEDRIAEAR